MGILQHSRCIRHAAAALLFNKGVLANWSGVGGGLALPGGRAASARQAPADGGLPIDASTMFLDCPAYMNKTGSVRCGLPAEVEGRYLMRSTEARWKARGSVPARPLVQRPGRVADPGGAPGRLGRARGHRPAQGRHRPAPSSLRSRAIPSGGQTRISFPQPDQRRGWRCWRTIAGRDAEAVAIMVGRVRPPRRHVGRCMPVASAVPDRAG